MNKIFNSLVEHYDSTRYEVGKVFGLDNVFHITEKREDGQHIEVLVGYNEDEPRVIVQGVMDGVVWGEREETDIDRTIELVKGAFEGIHNYLNGAHAKWLDLFRQDFNNYWTEAMRDDFKEHVEYVIEATDNFTPEKMMRYITQFEYRHNWRYLWDIFVSKLNKSLLWEAKAFYTFSRNLGFFNDEYALNLIREFAWENQVEYSSESFEGADGYDHEDINITGRIDLRDNAKHRIAYAICDEAKKVREHMKKTTGTYSNHILLYWDFFSDEDVDFIYSNQSKIKLFIYKYADSILGGFRTIDFDENGIEVTFFNNIIG